MEPAAATPSFTETLPPLRGLALYAQRTGHGRAGDAARRASEVLLQRRLFQKTSDGSVVREEFTKVHYPLYWHYDILGGLKVLAEARLMDRRCGDALDLLAGKRLPDGGWPTEAKHYQVSEDVQVGADAVEWGGRANGTPVRHA